MRNITDKVKLRELLMSRYLNPRSDAELSAYDTYWDAVSTEKTLLSERYRMGKAKGKTEGNAEMLMLLLGHKFKAVPMDYHQMIQEANAEILQKWARRALESATIESIFKD